MSPQEIKEILHDINFQAISSLQEPHSKTFPILINLVERLSEENEKLKIENQKLRDENNRLKGEQGKRNSLTEKEEAKAKAKTYPRKRTERNEKKKKGRKPEEQKEKHPTRSN